jgi:predicted TIM-barrel fold metal-dependent hydrolase
MEEILEKFKINFIFSSLGGIVPFLKDRFDRVYTMLRNREMVKDLKKLPSEILNKVYVDTSGSSLQNIRLALELFGEDKILWGSDYPVSGDIKSNLAMLDALDCKIKQKIIGDNFVNIFKRI